MEWHKHYVKLLNKAKDMVKNEKNSRMDSQMGVRLKFEQSKNGFFLLMSVDELKCAKKSFFFALLNQFPLSSHTFAGNGNKSTFWYSS